MSVTLAKVRGRVRFRLRDLDGRLQYPNGVEIDMAICEAWIALSAGLPAPALYVANAFTISAGTNTFSLPVTVTSSGYGTGTTEYRGEVRIQLAASALFLKKITNEQLDALKSGATVLPLAIPDRFALYEDNAQVVRGRCWPGVVSDQLCNLWATISPDDLRDYVGTGGSEGLDTVTVPGSRECVAALVAWTAGELLERMTDADAATRRLDKRAAESWKAEASDLLVQDEAAQHALASTGRVQRWTP